MVEQAYILKMAFPALMAVIAFAVMWGGVVVRMKFFGKDIEKLQSKKLDEKEHKHLDTNLTLRFEQHVSKEFKDFEERLLPKIAKLFNKENRK